MSEKGLRPGMWCRAHDKEEWLALMWAVSHLGLTMFPPTNMRPKFEDHPFVIVCQALPEFPMVQVCATERFLQKESEVSTIDFLVKAYEERALRDFSVDVSCDTGRESLPKDWWLGKGTSA